MIQKSVEVIKYILQKEQ